MGMYRIRTTFSGLQGAPYLSTFYFSDGGGTAQQAATAAGNFWAAVDAKMSVAMTWVQDSEVAEVNVGTGAVEGVSSIVPMNGVGGVAGDALPPATQGLVRWRTGVFVAGREIRGRTFIPGCVESESNGLPAGSSTAVWNAAASALIADATSLFVVWSKTHGVEQVVTAGGAWNQFAVLRSRRD